MENNTSKKESRPDNHHFLTCGERLVKSFAASHGFWYLLNRQNFNVIGFPTVQSNGEIIGEISYCSMFKTFQS